ncbi:MAG: hypothetical protein AMXMBFR45_13430 [Gammaproteobacteria bacterium]|nr:MAG: TVP38/TMEM64 family protein [Pseudomonadota bacterium]MBC6944738.1 TVP38/TMEM64 family protein [Gammaproteobacteria bacterium]MCE7896428.1 TVP38/TMEM64 family protein [Gammaproteobacteria bacterium PRO8]MDL1879999.1 TVP38/TMEM64 family protein [Gammaproteobacteria bacterium PRO2]MCL4778331.1 VTT domain-containing protein [Gammaproteobacteria bacterium]
MNRHRLLLLVLLAMVALAWVTLDAGQYLGIGALQQHYVALRALADAHPVAAPLLYSLAYIGIAATGIPGGALTCTLAGGALFGLAWGSVLVSFASSAGATLACAISRFLLRGPVERWFPAAVARADAGVRSDGAWYLLALRLATVVPYWLINLAMGLTRLPLRTFYWVSQVGMLPSTFLFVNAGAQLARVGSVADLLSPGLVLSLVLLGLFPLAARRLAGSVLAWQRRTG